jgi:hypothetical protein
MLERSARYSVDMSSHLSSPTSLTKSGLYACLKLLAFTMIKTRLNYRTHFPVIINFCSHSVSEVKVEICPGTWIPVCMFVGVVSDHTSGKRVSSIMFLSVRIYSGTSVHEFNLFLEAVCTRNVHKLKLLWLKKPQNTMKFKRSRDEFEQWCVLSESYTATDALSPILPACRQPLLLACVFVTREPVRHLRLFFFLRKFFHEPICSWWEAFVNWGSTV